MILLILALIPLVGGLVLEFLVCQFTRKGSRLWKLLPPIGAALVTVLLVYYRLGLWESEDSPVTQLLFIPGLPALRFDMIGNLQKNKINAVLGRAALIHSVSSLHLARAIAERAARRIDEGASVSPQDVLLEVNISGEASKSGFAPDELRSAMDELQGLRGIRLRGLMTMAPRGDKDRARRTFSGLRALRDELEGAYPSLDLSELSCGMSEDFEAALEEGSTLIRLGRVVFDPAFELE